MSTVHAWLPSPIGRLLLTGDGTALTRVWFPSADVASDGTDDERHGWDEVPEGSREDPVALAAPLAQLQEYFAGERRDFDLELAPEGTDFQQAVWAALREIPYAETTSYGAIATALGDPGASRAVGAANGSNPIPIIVPCHRVIGADGSLTGFGGGLARKRWLLEHEGAAGFQQGLFD